MLMLTSDFPNLTFDLKEVKMWGGGQENKEEQSFIEHIQM